MYRLHNVWLLELLFVSKTKIFSALIKNVSKHVLYIPEWQGAALLMVTAKLL